MIALMQFLSVFALGMIRFRWAVYAFVFFLAFSPRTLGFLLSGGSLSVTFSRMTFPILLIVFFLSKLASPSGVFHLKPKLMKTSLFQTMLSLSLLKILTTLLNGQSPIYAVEDAIVTTLVFGFFYTISTERFVDNVIIVMLTAMCLTGAIVVVENFVQYPLHSPLASASLGTEDALRIRMRGGIYRAQGVFDNPLSLSEFSLFCLPIAMAGTILMRKKGKVLAYCAVALALFSMISTGSRSGMLGGVITILSFVLYLNWNRFSKKTKISLGLLISISMLYAVFSAFGMISLLAERAQSTKFYLIESETEVSTLSRALQYHEVFTALIERPLVGFGVLQNFASNLDEIHRIDNYYLRVGLEAGFLGIILFVSILSLMFRRITKVGRERVGGRKERAFNAMCMGILVAFSVNKLFISIPTNNIYFFLLMGAFLGATRLRSEIRRGGL